MPQWLLLPGWDESERPPEIIENPGAFSGSENSCNRGTVNLELIRDADLPGGT